MHLFGVKPGFDPGFCCQHIECFIPVPLAATALLGLARKVIPAIVLITTAGISVRNGAETGITETWEKKKPGYTIVMGFFWENLD